MILSDPMLSACTVPYDAAPASTPALTSASKSGGVISASRSETVAIATGEKQSSRTCRPSSGGQSGRGLPFNVYLLSTLPVRTEQMDRDCCSVAVAVGPPVGNQPWRCRAVHAERGTDRSAVGGSRVVAEVVGIIESAKQVVRIVGSNAYLVAHCTSLPFRPWLPR